MHGFPPITDQGSSDGWILVCPVCGDDYSHHGPVEVFDRPYEDGDTQLLTPGRAVRQVGEGNPSRRRGAVRVWIEGECGHYWTFDLVQHKGNTFVEVTPQESWPDENQRGTGDESRR